MALELAWRQEVIKGNISGTNQPPWHGQFKPGNTHGRQRKGKILTKTLRKVLSRLDASGQTMAEHLLLEMLARAMEGNGTVFSKIADLVQPQTRNEALLEQPPQQLVIRVRPHPKLEADVSATDPSDPA